MIAPSLRMRITSIRSPLTQYISQTSRPSNPRVSARVSCRGRHDSSKSEEPVEGTTTPAPEGANPRDITSPFYFEAGYALFAKRPSRAFPPPFLSRPSTSFSEPLSTHDKSRDRRPTVHGDLIRGVTNGDDAVLVGENFIGANDGVGAWASRPKGHAALWSRLILHFWALEVERATKASVTRPDLTAYLQSAYEQTKNATSGPNEWHGTTTACGALLSSDGKSHEHPILYVTQLGDSQVLVVRPRNKHVVFKTQEQWHWFDCPRQLGTNSPDKPAEHAVTDRIMIEEDDVVLAMTDGVIDNLWEHEIVQSVVDSLDKWAADTDAAWEEQTLANSMRFVAKELVNAARNIAQDPFAESPYMEKAIDEGLSIEGGKLDDISVVAAQCKRRKG